MAKPFWWRRQLRTAMLYAGCRVRRSTLCAFFSDIIGREIQLERRNIVEKLASFLIAKLSQVAAGATPELLPQAQAKFV
jgi:hypothetical protein